MKGTEQLGAMRGPAYPSRNIFLQTNKSKKNSPILCFDFKEFFRFFSNLAPNLVLRIEVGPFHSLPKKNVVTIKFYACSGETKGTID